MAWSKSFRIFIIFILAIIATYGVNVILPQTAQAQSCSEVAELEETIRLKGQIDFAWSYTRKGIDFGATVYQSVLNNPNCVSKRRYQEARDVVLSLKDACTPRKPSSPGYARWKQTSLDYYKGLYGKNFNYMCSKWKSIRL